MTMTRLIVKGTRTVAIETARHFGLEVEWQHETRFMYIIGIPINALQPMWIGCNTASRCRQSIASR